VIVLRSGPQASRLSGSRWTKPSSLMRSHESPRGDPWALSWTSSPAGAWAPSSGLPAGFGICGPRASRSSTPCGRGHGYLIPLPLSGSPDRISKHPRAALRRASHSVTSERHRHDVKQPSSSVLPHATVTAGMTGNHGTLHQGNAPTASARTVGPRGCYVRRRYHGVQS